LTDKLNEAYKSSIIVKFFANIASYLGYLYNYSGISKILNGIASFFKKLGSGSGFIGFIKKDTRPFMELSNSRIYKLVERIVNWPSKALRKLYAKSEDVFEELWLFQILKALLRKFDILIGIAVALIVVVPNNLWFNGYSTIIAAGLFLLFFLKTIIRKHDSFNIKAIDAGLALFFITIVLAEILSFYPLKGLTFFVFYFTCFLMVLVMISSIRTGAALNRFAEIMLVGIALTGIYGVYQKVIGVPVDPSLTDVTLNEGMPGRIYSTFGNPNNYAEALVLTIPFFFAVILNSKTFVKKAIYIIMLLPVLIALLATGSRSSWIACALSIFVFVFFKNKKLIPLILLCGLVGFFLLPYISEPTYKRLMTLFASGTVVDSSINYRSLIFKTIKPIIKDYWISGVGLSPATFMEVCKNYYIYTPTKVVPPHTHNLYLQILIEGGVVSILSFLWLIARVMKKAIKIISRKENKDIENVIIAGIAAIAGICIMGLAEYVWFYARVMLLFWIVIGMVLAAISIAVSKSELYGE